MMRAALAVSLWAIGAGRLYARAAAPQDSPTTVRLTADDAVARALAASPRLARLAALEAAAEAQRRGAAAERLPQLDLGGGYTRRSHVPELVLTLPGAIPSQPPQRVTVFPDIPDNLRVRAGLAVPLYTGGRLENQLEAARQGRAAAEQDLRSGRADLVLETKTAYWSLMTARDSLRVLQEAIRAYEAHLSDARNRERFGVAARNEVLAVQVERDRVELDRLRAEVGAEVAEANLQRLLDLPPTARIEATDELSSEAVETPDLEALVARAAAERPDRAALAARVAAADAAAGAERGARLPQVAATGGFTYAKPNRDIVPPMRDWKQSWDLGIGLSWNALDFGRRSASLARARAQADAVREQLRELDRAIRLEVTQRALELRTARARVTVAESGIAAALENRKVAGDRYREGVIASSDLLDAEVAYERASLARTEALASLRLAAAGLDRALGR